MKTNTLNMLVALLIFLPFIISFEFKHETEFENSKGGIQIIDHKPIQIFYINSKGEENNSPKPNKHKPTQPVESVDQEDPSEFVLSDRCLSCICYVSKNIKIINSSTIIFFNFFF
jgi:hypothetical protein